MRTSVRFCSYIYVDKRVLVCGEPSADNGYSSLYVLWSFGRPQVKANSHCVSDVVLQSAHPLSGRMLMANVCAKHSRGSSQWRPGHNMLKVCCDLAHFTVHHGELFGW